MIYKKKKHLRKVKGYTLMELLVVLIIIGILILIAYPNLMPLISNARSTEAKTQLEHIYTLEKTYFFEYSRYSNNPNEIGFEQMKLNNQENGTANYRVDIIEANNTHFLATATSITDYDGDGVFNVWNIDENKKLTESVKD